jgi:hypothetical protein
MKDPNKCFDPLVRENKKFITNSDLHELIALNKIEDDNNVRASGDVDNMLQRVKSFNTNSTNKSIKNLGKNYNLICLK